MYKPFIAIAGIIGAGKSTFADKLSKALEIPIFKEPVEENPFLEMFYRDMKKWSFAMQVFLLNARFKQHQKIVWSEAGAVQDRSIYEDTIFAEMLYRSELMTKLEYDTYLDLFINNTKYLQRPDIILYLDVTPEEALRRINNRNRSAENGMTLDYLTNLQAGYEHFINDMSGILNIKRINWQQFRDVGSVIDEAELMNKSVYVSNRWGSHL